MFTVFLTYFWQTSAETLTSLLSCVWLTGCCWLSVRCTVHLISARGDRGKHSRKEEFPSTPYTTFTSTESESDGATEGRKTEMYFKVYQVFRNLQWVFDGQCEQQVLTHKHKILTIISFTVIINTVTNVSEKQRKLQLHTTTCRVRRAPACSTEQSDWRTKCLLHIYILSLSLYYRRSETCRNIKKKVSIINRRQWTIYDVPIISDVQ